MVENDLSGQIVGGAIEVHRALGPGLLESVYEEALAIELQDRSLVVARQVTLPIEYKGKPLETALRLDMLVNNMIVVEVKSVERVLPVHGAQLLTYLRLTGMKLGLLINFNTAVLSKGVQRIVNRL